MEQQLNLAIEAAVPDSVGREKRLDDVLRALQKIEDADIVVTTSGEFDDNEHEYFPAQWTLGLSLSQQSDDVKRFLHSLLCL